MTLMLHLRNSMFFQTNKIIFSEIVIAEIPSFGNTVEKYINVIRERRNTISDNL